MPSYTGARIATGTAGRYLSGEYRTLRSDELTDAAIERQERHTRLETIARDQAFQDAMRAAIERGAERPT